MANDSYVGIFMVERPPEWRPPDGYTLAPNGRSVPIDVTAPDGSSHYAYVDPSYRPPPARVEAITDLIQRELGPVPGRGIGPETRQALGMDRGDALGAINRTIMAPVDLGVWLIDLASYGIDASVVASTEGIAHAGCLDPDAAGHARRGYGIDASVVASTEGIAHAGCLDPDAAGHARREILGLLEIAGAESGARAGSLGVEARAARLRIATAARAARLVAAPTVMRLERADVQLSSTKEALREAYRDVRPGTVIADVPSRPRELTKSRLSGQLWLEVPVQTKPVPTEILALA